MERLHRLCRNVSMTRLSALLREGNEHEAYEIDEAGFCRRPVKQCGNSSRGTGAHETREYAHYEWHSHIDHCGFAHRTHSVTQSCWGSKACAWPDRGKRDGGGRGT